jgi:hypothetical protein
MSNLRYMSLSTHSGVQHIVCCVLFSLSSSYVPYVVSFSGLSIFDCLCSLTFTKSIFIISMCRQRLTGHGFYAEFVADSTIRS